MPDTASLLPQSAVEGVMTIPVAPGTGENNYAESHNRYSKQGRRQKLPPNTIPIKKDETVTL